uniref:Transthyretin-like family protein n=1 Tax=Steinernema glaseri TaxID=37863 RepID=A0A1I8A688_9BILA
MRALYSLLVVLAVFTVAVFSLPTIGKLQSAGVKGKLLCNGKPYHNAKVKLYDVDLTDLDDLMAQGRSNEDGEFELQGNETEWSTIDPKLNIYHNCNDEDVECDRKISIIIPKSFVSAGGVPEKIFDAGVLNLSGKLPGETRDCIN